MSIKPTTDKILSTIMRMSDSEIVESMQRKIKRFDEYERKEKEMLDTRYENHSPCGRCPDDRFNHYPESELYEDDEYGWLCDTCLIEVEDERQIIKEEEINHHK